MAYTVAVLGATGAVGAELLKLLGDGRIPASSVRALASGRSAGSTVNCGELELPVQAVNRESFRGVDIALFSAGAARSRQWAPVARDAGAVVIDNSSAFRMDPVVPLVVPEVNPEVLAEHRGIVANPNCTTIVALMAMAPIHRAAGLLRVRAASYQAVSGAGRRGIDELLGQSAAGLDVGDAVAPDVFPHPIAFNVIPHVGGFLDDGETEEERKFRDETRKILGLPGLTASATCVRVPVVRAHSVALWLETERPLSPAEAREVLRVAPGVKVVDDPAALAYPMPVSAAGRSSVLVGRIRADHACTNGLAMFAAGDQLLKGAALNAVQIAETLIREEQLQWPR